MKKGQLAATLFCVLGFGGILTLFSQSQTGAARDRTRAMNVSSPTSSVFRKTVPAAIESGTFSTDKKRAPKRRPNVLTLR